MSPAPLGGQPFTFHSERSATGGQLSAIGDWWSDFADLDGPIHSSLSALNVPSAPGSKLSTRDWPLSSVTDTLFATLSERADSATQDRVSSAGEGIEATDESEDGLDLWALLHGLD